MTKKMTHGTEVKFRLVLPGEHEVFLAGTFNKWRPKMLPMIAVKEGTWVRSLTLPPGRYEYLFVADGVWMTDPLCPESTPNAGGGVHSVVTVPAASR